MSRGTALTVIAAVSNEAVQLAEWLQHLDWVDRIVVADTGSRDGSQAILAAAGAEVIQAPTLRAGAVIHTAKNLALARVGAGWVLDLDVDERVPLPLRREIEQRLGRADPFDPGLADPAPSTDDVPDDPVPVASVAPMCDAYRLPFRHYVFGRWLRHGGWRTRHLRLYRAECAHYVEDRAHSRLEVRGTVGELQEPVVHFAHPQLHDFLVKMNRYTSQDAPLTVRNGKGGLRDRAPLPARRLPYLRASLGVFWNRYIKARGYRDGMPGFLVAALMGAYAFVEQAKVWELCRQQDVENPLHGGNSSADVDHPSPP